MQNLIVKPCEGTNSAVIQTGVLNAGAVHVGFINSLEDARFLQTAVHGFREYEDLLAALLRSSQLPSTTVDAIARVVKRNSPHLLPDTSAAKI